MSRSAWDSGGGTPVPGVTTGSQWQAKYSPVTFVPPSSYPGPSGKAPKKKPAFSQLGKFDISPMSLLGNEGRYQQPVEDNNMLNQLPDLMGSWLSERAPEPLKGVAGLVGRGVGGVLGLTGNVLADMPSPMAPVVMLASKQAQENNPNEYAEWLGNNPEAPGQNELDRTNDWLRFLYEKKQVGPKLTRDVFTPTASVGAGLLSVLNATSIPSRLLQRNIIGEEATFKRIMDSTEAEGPLAEMRQRYAAGELTKHDVIDQAIVDGYGFNNDLLVSTALTIATDPAIWATFGAGAIERAGTAAGLRLGTRFMSELSTDAAAALTREAVEAGVTRGLTQRANVELFDYAMRTGKYTAEVERAMAAHPMAARIYMTPQVAKISRAVSRVLDPFSIMNGEKKQRGVSAWLSSEATQGMMDSYGATSIFRVRQAIKRMGLAEDTFDESLGRATSQTALKVGDNAATKRQIRLAGVDAAENPTWQAKVSADAMSDASLRRAVAEEIDRVREPGSVAEAAAYFQRLGASAEDALAQASRLQADDLSVIHYANFGRSVDEFLKAQRSAIGRFKALTSPTKGGKRVLDPSSASFANRDTLTSAEAIELRKAIKRGDAEAVHTAVRRYSVLDKTIDLTKSDGEVMKQVDELLSSMLERGHLPVLVDEAEVVVDDELLAFVRDNDPYRLIYRPPDDSLVHTSRTADGRLNGITTWIDWVDGAAAPIVTGRLGAWKKDAFRPVYFATIAREAGRRFTRSTMSSFGLTETEAGRLFRSTLKAAEDLGVTPRGMTAPEMYEAAMRTAIPQSRNITQRQYVDEFLKAWEGNLATVGLTQKVSGRAKTLAHRLTGGNPLGLIAERAYPMMRYKFNPFYIAQEVFETPINMLSRGIMPWRYDESLMDDTRRLMGMMPETEYAADQVEMTNLVLFQSEAAARVAGKSKAGLARATNFLKGMVGQAPKKTAEVRQYINRVGDDFARDMLQQSPETYGRVMAEYGHLPGGQRGAIIRWLHDLAARSDPESLFSIDMPAAVRPSIIGQRAQVSERLVAHLAGAEDFKSLRRDVLNGGNAEWNEQVVAERLMQAGADQDYIQRAMAHVVGPTEDEWYEGLMDLGMTAKETEAMKDLIGRVAEMYEVTPRELIGMTQAGKPLSINELGKYRGPTLYQSVVDANEARGFKTLPVDSPEVQRMTEVANRELQAVARSASGAKKVRTYTAATERYRVSGVGKPMGQRVEFHGPKPKEGEMAGLPIHYGGEVNAEDHMALLSRVFTEEDIRSMALWYDQMRSSILALANNDPELGAKMLLRFAYTQMNTSPEQGMRLMLRFTEDLHTGALTPETLLAAWDEATEAGARAAYGLNAQRLLKSGADIWEEADAIGLGQKLMDFTDSMVGNRLRMADGYRSLEQGGTGLGPYAGDVHARRSEGFFDIKQTNYIRHMTGDETVVYDPARGYVGADGTVYVDANAVSADSQPTADEYAYILQHGNDMVEAFNREQFAGIDNWTSEKVQAVLWARVRQSSGDYAGDPLSALYSNIWSAGMEIKPGRGAPSIMYPFDTLTTDQQDLITERAGHIVADMAAEMSGTRVISRARRRGGWEGGLSPNFSAEVAASPEGAQNFADAVALYAGQDEVWMSRTMRTIDEARVEAGGPKPVLTKASGAGVQKFSVDVTLPEGTTPEQLDDIARAMDGKADLWPGRGFTISRQDDGRFMVRFIDNDSRTWGQHTKALTDERLDAFDDFLSEQGITGHNVDRSIVHVVIGKHNAHERLPQNYGSSLIKAARQRNPAFADQLERGMGRAREGVEQAFHDVDARRLAEHRAGLASRDPRYDYTRLPPVGAADGGPLGIAYQRNKRTIRGATVTLENARRLIFINERMKRGDTYLHEVWHSLEPMLDPSAKTRIVDAYNAARKVERVAGTPLPRAQRQVTGPVSEWFVQQMVEYFKTGRSPHPSLRNTFEFYRETLKNIRKGKGEAKPYGHFADVAEEVFKVRPKGRANYDIDQSALTAMAHQRMVESARFAQRWTYFRPARTPIERSLNHPYLGFYPVSYMYGQVLPHLVEFLAMRPFGLKAPFGGLLLTNQVYRAMMQQQSFDPELRQFLADNEPGLRAISTFTPGLPWEVPVNVSPIIRHIISAEAENLQREQQGLERKNIDYLRVATDVAGRAFNPLQQVETLTDAGAGLATLGGALAGQAMQAPEYATASESFLQQDASTPETPVVESLPAPNLPGPLSESSESVGESQDMLTSAADALQSLFDEGVYPER